jgi:hypothetical protein
MIVDGPEPETTQYQQRTNRDNWVTFVSPDSTRPCMVKPRIQQHGQLVLAKD